MQNIRAVPFIFAALGLILVISYNRHVNNQKFNVLLSKGGSKSIVVNGIELRPLDTEADQAPKLESSPDSIVVNGIELHAMKSLPTINHRLEAARQVSSRPVVRSSAAGHSSFQHLAISPEAVVVNGIELEPVGMDEDDHLKVSNLHAEPAAHSATIQTQAAPKRPAAAPASVSTGEQNSRYCKDQRCSKIQAIFFACLTAIDMVAVSKPRSVH